MHLKMASDFFIAFEKENKEIISDFVFTFTCEKVGKVSVTRTLQREILF